MGIASRADSHWEAPAADREEVFCGLPGDTAGEACGLPADTAEEVSGHPENIGERASADPESNAVKAPPV